MQIYHINSTEKIVEILIIPLKYYVVYSVVQYYIKLHW